MIRVIGTGEVVAAQTKARDNYFMSVINSGAIHLDDAKLYASRWWPRADEALAQDAWEVGPPYA